MNLRTSALLLLATGCASAAAAGAHLSPAKTDRRLVVLHASDLESELLASDGSGGIARFAAVVDALRRKSDAPVITVAAGDTFMPAPALQVEIDGQNAVSLANGFAGFQASALGNHEFDKGEDFLAERIRAARFPYLTATVDFEGGALDAIDGEIDAIAGRTPWLAEYPGRVLPRGLLCAGGELLGEEKRCTGLTVGVVGATTHELRAIASTAVTVGTPANLAELRARVQAQVDSLAAEGVDIVVLLSHLQDVRAELQLVRDGLTGVDLIVSGGGDDRLADEGHRLLAGDTPHDVCANEVRCYPIVRTANDGRPVAIVAADGQMRYVGSLGLSFDARGVITAIDPASRPWPVDDATLAALDARPATEAAALEARVAEELAASRTAIAVSRVFLDGEREAVRNRETNLGNLSSDSLVWAARAKGFTPAFGVRNGGGIRASIGRIDPATGDRSGGPITRLDLREALRFDNELVLVTATHRALADTFAASLRGLGTGRGHFPQVSDALVIRVAGSALDSVHVGGTPVVEHGAVVDPEATITFVTLSYLARGGDGWFEGHLDALQIAPLGITEQQALAGFLAAQAEAGTWDEGRRYATVGSRIVRDDQ